MRLKISLPLLLSLLYFQVLLTGEAAAAPQTEKDGYRPERHIPILYEAYYPEPARQWSPSSSLQEIEKLRELTSRLLKEEEQLEQLAAAAVEAVPENIYEPRGQILEYVFSRPAVQQPPAPAPATKPPGGEDVQVASITVSESAPRHRTRHHHGQADWLVRRLAAAAGGR